MKKVRFGIIAIVFADDLTFTVTKEGTYTYTVNTDNVSVTITRFVPDTGANSNPFIKIPLVIDNKPITSIGSYTFSNCTSLTTINIPSGVKSIEKSAF
ncbi:MAG: leucine-rich repeat protein [Oscillospiraceae bacterium]